MKHFRPIKTFSTWLLEEVRVEMAPLENDPWNGGGIDEWIQQNLGLYRKESGDLRSDIYSHCGSGFPVAGHPYQHILNFPEAKQAIAFQKEFGGQYTTLTMANNPRRNEEIFGNFTLDDLVHMYGNPLPNVIQYHLLDMTTRLSGYFDDFKFMHQDWARDWIPSAFIYIRERTNAHSDEILKWFYDTLGGDEIERHGWQRGWESSAMGIYEFDDPAIAALFKLSFGDDPIPNGRISIRHDHVWKELNGPVSGLYKDRNGIWWVPDPKAPTHAKLLI